MDKIRPRTLSGFMELPPDKQVQMDKMRAVLAETYARYGFTPLDTPAIEAAEVLLAKGGGETENPPISESVIRFSTFADIFFSCFCPLYACFFVFRLLRLRRSFCPFSFRKFWIVSQIFV